MKGHAKPLVFEEEQRFPLWIRAIMLLVTIVIGWPAILLLPILQLGIGFIAIFLITLLVAVLTFRTKLVTRLDSSGLHLRIHPKWNLLPRRMIEKDILLDDIQRWEVRTYNSLFSREYWGWHFWGLGAGKGGRYIYVMRPSGPFSGRGVQLQTCNGEKVLVGSQHPEELENAITTAKSAFS